MTVGLITLDGTISTGEGFALIGLYASYVMVVVLDAYIYKAYKLLKSRTWGRGNTLGDMRGGSMNPLMTAEEDDEEPPDEIVGYDPHAPPETEPLLPPSSSIEAYENLPVTSGSNESMRAPPLLQTTSDTVLDISNVLPDELTALTIARLQLPMTRRPLIVESFWKSLLFPLTLDRLVKLPFMFILVSSIPLPTTPNSLAAPLPFHFGYTERPNAKPPRWLIVFQTAATFLMLYFTLSISPWYLMIGLVAPVAYWAPESVRIVIGTVNCCLMMNLIATGLVEVIVDLGEYFGIPETVMGLSVFAIGNSIGDLAADVAVARLGMGAMAISACFGGPMMSEFHFLLLCLHLTDLTFL